MIVDHYKDEYKADVICLIKKFQLLFLCKYGDEYNAAVIDKTIASFSGENAKNAFLLVIEGKCIGLLAGVATDSYIDTKKIFYEIFWYIDEPYGKYALWFINRIEKMLKNYGFNTMIMSVLDSEKTDRIKKMYEFNGYKILETSYQKAL